MDTKAKLIVARGYNLPLAKLTIRGDVEQFETKEDQDSAKQFSNHAIIFVIDRSYSMNGSRLASVKEALLSFIPNVCEFSNVKIKLILFNRGTQTWDIPTNSEEATKLIQEKVVACGGTDFHVASQALVECADNILNKFSDYRISLIMCSDGQVDKKNANEAHLHWKKWVNNKYLKKHSIVPYVSTVGISASHDADILDGFICNDTTTNNTNNTNNNKSKKDEINGNYVFCDNSDAILEAFNNASQDTIGQNKGIKLTIEFPFEQTTNAVFHQTSNNNNNNNDETDSSESKTNVDFQESSFFKMDEITIRSDLFEQTYWVSMQELTPKGQSTTNDNIDNNNLYIKINGTKIKIKWQEIDIKNNFDECHVLAISFYHQMLQDMLHILKNITDLRLLQTKARMIENVLKSKSDIFEQLMADPPKKTELQNEIRSLLQNKENGDNDDSNDKKDWIGKRAQLMKEYKKYRETWITYRQSILPFETTLNELKKLVREILIGESRIQEIRQHILDLHYKKNHKKRIEKLILTDEQLLSRQSWQKQLLKENLAGIENDMECKNLTNDYGTGCYLSLLSLKEIVFEGEPLWLCGEIDRTGGALVSNPELIKIKYISNDLISHSYFDMAMETIPNGFVDSSRNVINARLFPIYANTRHFKCTKAFLNDGLSHALSGRNDIQVVDYTSLFVIIGYIISMMDIVIAKQMGNGNNNNNDNNKEMITSGLYSTFWLNMLFNRILPSMHILANSIKVKPYETNVSRQSAKHGKKITLMEQSLTRLSNYVNYFEARTTALVSCHQVLFCDKLIHFGRTFGNDRKNDNKSENDDSTNNTNDKNENNNNVELKHDFWLSLVLQRLRQCVKQQIPSSSDEMDEQNRVLAIHSKCLQIIVRGIDKNKELKNNKDDSKHYNDKETKLLKLGKNSEPTRMEKVFKLPKSLKENEFFKDYESKKAKENEKYDANRLDEEMLEMCSQILNYIDIRDCIQACTFFNKLEKIGFNYKAHYCDNNNDNDKMIEELRKMTKEEVEDDEKLNNNKKSNDITWNDFYKFCDVIGWKFDINTIRAIIGVALVTGFQNSTFRNKASIFCDNNKKELFNDANTVLNELNKIVETNDEYNYKVWKENEEIERLHEIHTNPLLPDNVDEFGNLPHLTCAWSKCGKKFDNRDHLFAHVARVRKTPLAHRFHLYCRGILERNPQQTYEQFLRSIKEKFNDSQRKTLTTAVTDAEIKAYYDQFVPIFSKQNN